MHRLDRALMFLGAFMVGCAAIITFIPDTLPRIGALYLVGVALACLWWEALPWQ